jgi:hypothetical protein
MAVSLGEGDTDRSPDDGQKLIRMEAGTADEGTVHSRARQQLGSIVGLDAASILDGQRLSRFLVEHLTAARPNDGVSILSLLGCGMVPKIANRPEWFVRDGQAR